MYFAILFANALGLILENNSSYFLAYATSLRWHKLSSKFWIAKDTKRAVQSTNPDFSLVELVLESQLQLYCTTSFWQLDGHESCLNIILIDLKSIDSNQLASGSIQHKRGRNSIVQRITSCCSLVFWPGKPQELSCNLHHWVIINLLLGVKLSWHVISLES